MQLAYGQTGCKGTVFVPWESASVYECARFIWPYNTQPVLLKKSAPSRPQGRNADDSPNWPAILDFERNGDVTRNSVYTVSADTLPAIEVSLTDSDVEDR